MQHALEALEFPAVQTLWKQFLGSPAARQRMALVLSREVEPVREGLAETAEARTALCRAGVQPYGDLPDLHDALTLARIEGAHIEPTDLLAIARFLETSDAIAISLRSVPNVPRLARWASAIASADELARAIRRAVLPGGGLADAASPGLREIRRSLASKRLALEGVMGSFLQDQDSERVLQDKLITTRNERYVLLVKTHQRGQLPGIVHGSSGSGASVFIEPLAAVDLNNEIVSLTSAEQTEIARILQELTQSVRERADDLDQTSKALLALDAAQARARLAEAMDATCPEIIENRDGGALDLREARHPLLIPALASRLGLPGLGRNPIPVSIQVGGAETALVISGPNTGGKTVALKTVGLLAAMTQAGLHVPVAPGSRLPVFRRVFADIGDEQSVAENLSTFSGHIAAVVGMAKSIETPTLVLLDEPGMGTDPMEGGALAAAIIDDFRRRGALVLATTHHGEVKDYAEGTTGVATASFAYDAETYAPTYRLERGVPGRSLALEIAERLGLGPELLADARSRREAGRARVEDLLERLERDRQALAAEQTRLREEHDRMQEARAAQSEAARDAARGRQQQAQTFARQLESLAERAAQDTREAVSAAVRRVEQTRGTPASAARRARSQALGEICQAHDRAVDIPELRQPIRSPEPVSAGDTVRVPHLRLTGQVLGAMGGRVEVAVRGKRLWVSPEEVERVVGTTAAPGPGTSFSSGAEREAPGEINVIGLTVDEALPQVDKLLDAAVLADRPSVRVIHGHGRGRLRQAVGGLLREHPLVATFRSADSRDGGTGVTVVELKG
jgi:DNA mismatch repair protein MutS2